MFKDHSEFSTSSDTLTEKDQSSITGEDAIGTFEGYKTRWSPEDLETDRKSVV